MKRMRIQYGKDEGCSMERMNDAVWKG